MNFKRTQIMFVTAVLILTALCTKILHISINKHREYSEEVFSQQKNEVFLQRIRGEIVDQNGIAFTNRKEKTLHIGRGGKICDESSVAVRVPQRYDPTGLASHVIGYVSDDGEGVSGIEKHYNHLLTSSGSYRATYFADGSGTPFAQQKPEVFKDKSENTNSVKLTLDYHIQQIAENVADNHIERGAVVVLDAKSFDVLAMVSRPDFDRNNVSAYLDSPNGEFLNRALCGYNAGSVFKIITAAAVLDKHPDYASSMFYCGGSFQHGEKTFNCHQIRGHGNIDFFGGFAESCNCVFYESGLMIGANEIYATAKKIGVGENVLFWNEEESAGNIIYKASYSPFETVNLSIGQGEVLLTPLQCAVMAATVANSGVRKSVNIVDSVTNEKGEVLKNLKKSQSVRAMKEATARAIGSMMRQCTLSGTATAAMQTSIAGKTGSAETGWLTSDGTTAVHGWFCGYFPYDNPKYAMAVFCEDGKSGAESCVEPFMKIYEEICKIYPFKQ